VNTRTRQILEARDSDRHAAPSLGTGELLPVFALLWVASVARVVAGFLRHETFGTVGTLALVAVFLLPLLMRTSRH
jgi:hypothetical protein